MWQCHSARHSNEVSQASIRRFPCPQGCCAGNLRIVYHKNQTYGRRIPSAAGVHWRVCAYATRSQQNTLNQFAHCSATKMHIENGLCVFVRRRGGFRVRCERRRRSRDETWRTWRGDLSSVAHRAKEEVSCHGAARRIMVAQQPALTRPDFVVARSAKHTASIGLHFPPQASIRNYPERDSLVENRADLRPFFPNRIIEIT